jgi:hypothetical protein
LATVLQWFARPDPSGASWAQGPTVPLARVTPPEEPLDVLALDEELDDDDPELLLEVDDDVLELPVLPVLDEELLAVLEAPTALVVAPLELAVVELEPTAPEPPLQAASNTIERRTRERRSMPPSTRTCVPAVNGSAKTSSGAFAVQSSPRNLG